MPTNVLHWEVNGQPVENWGEDEFTATRQLRCAWSDRLQLMADLIGGRDVYPYFDSGSRLTARTGGAVPFGRQVGESGVTASYETALVTINYSTKGNDKEGNQGDLYSETLEPNVEFLTLGHEDFRWGSADGEALKENEAPGRLIRSLDYLLTIYQVYAIPSAVLDLIGCVNYTSWLADLLGLTFPAGTLLYNPPQITRKITFEEIEPWTLSFRFSYRPDGWNKFWRQKTQQFESIYHKDEGLYYNYPEGEFGWLFS